MAAESNPPDTGISPEDAAVYEALSALFDARARERILEAWAYGWITPEDALALLINLDLTEASAYG